MVVEYRVQSSESRVQERALTPTLSLRERGRKAGFRHVTW